MKNKSNKELARNKEVALTKEQIKRLYEYQPTGTENKFKIIEVKDLFVLQCLVGQRISDMRKLLMVITKEMRRTVLSQSFRKRLEQGLLYL